MDPSYCPDGGWLVSEATVPADPSDHWHPGIGEVLGCNALRCATCGAPVRSAANLEPRRRLGKNLRELADTADWTRSPLLQATWASRLYACLCTSWEESSRRRLREPDPDPLSDPTLPWACGGHPAPALPVTVEGLTIDGSTDLAGLVRGVLDGRVPAGATALWTELPASWLGRVYHRLRGLPEAGVFVEAVSGALRSEQPRDVGAALFFHRRWPSVGGTGVEELANRAGVDAVFPCPLRDGALPELPAMALAARARSGEVSADVIRLLRSAATSTEPTLADADRRSELLSALALRDGPWLARNVVAVSSEREDRALATLRALREAGDDALVLVAGTALIDDGRLIEAVRRHVASPFARVEGSAAVLARRLG